MRMGVKRMGPQANPMMQKLSEIKQTDESKTIQAGRSPDGSEQRGEP
jgi:hypothetical protein